MIVDHTTNQRNGSEISKIWQHGGERRRVDDGTMDRYWRCGHCNNKRILKCPETGRGATSYPIRHLKNRHFIDLNADHQALPLQLTSFFGTVAGAAASIDGKANGLQQRDRNLYTMQSNIHFSNHIIPPVVPS